MNETYLGDGLYASFDGYQHKLFTQEGNEVYLDDTVCSSFIQHLEKCHNIKFTVKEIENEEAQTNKEA